MAGAKELKERIKSVKNTKKITKTMEMVSTAKSRKMMTRVNAAKPYGEKLVEIMESLSGRGASIESPYLRSTDHPKKVVLLVITANRGLCGGYNSNVLKMARNRVNEYKEQEVATETYVIGKKGISFFNFLGMDMELSENSKEDNVTFEDTLKFSEGLMSRFAAGNIDRVEIVSTVYYSSASQKAEISVMLPVGGEVGGKKSGEKGTKSEAKAMAGGDMIYDPAPDVILKNLIPHMIKANLYRLFLEAAAAEWIYRRVAMKSATDAASEMQKMLNRTYNRIRQASITQEIGEIVAGADSVQ